MSNSLFLILELGILTGKLDGHAVPPRQITFSSTGRYCLTASTREAMVWDLDSNTQIHRLSLHRNVVVRQVLYADEIWEVFPRLKLEVGITCYIYFTQASKDCRNLCDNEPTI